MASVVIAGNTSGTVTLDAPAVAGSTVLTLPAVSGTVLTSSIATVPAGSVNQAAMGTNVANTGPLFNSYADGSQSLPTLTWTKVLLTELTDTNDNFASSRFTPTIAGYYQINLIGLASPATGITSVASALYKNGVAVSAFTQENYNSTSAVAPFSDIVYCNGTTDYIEMYMFLRASATGTVNSNTFFSGSLIRAA
jgi:hypothetical protein